MQSAYGMPITSGVRPFPSLQEWPHRAKHRPAVDHVDLSSDLDHGKDYYDGLLDIVSSPPYDFRRHERD